MTLRDKSHGVAVAWRWVQVPSVTLAHGDVVSRPIVDVAVAAGAVASKGARHLACVAGLVAAL